MLKRPFSNTHWSLFPALVAIWGLLLGQLPCRESPYYLETTLATATGCIALWASHLRASPVLTWRGVIGIIGGAIYDLVLLILLSALLSTSILVSTYDCHAPRAKVLELILSTAPLRSEINGRIAQGKSLSGVGAELQIEVAGRTKWGVVTNDGSIIIASEDPLAVVVLQPKLVSGEVSWKCSGFPIQDIIPGSCP